MPPSCWCPGPAKAGAGPRPPSPPLAGVSPLEASSGKITRHRLNRFGDRQLNRALHVIVNWRMLHDTRTRNYLARRRAEHKTGHEIRRCLKHYPARQLFRLIETASTT